jgi:magnesium chelatase family protein
MPPPMPVVSAATIEAVAQPAGPALTLLREASEAMKLSARGFHRVLRVARTLADLEGEDEIGRAHVAEALSYRSRHEGAGAGLR